MRRLWLFLVVTTSLAHADAGDALRSEAVTDELALAQIADAAGDGAIGKALSGQARGQALVAARAAVHTAAPELLVPALVELALSRDPALAGEAAESLTAIFDRLTPSELGAREVLLADLRASCAAFEKLKAAPTPRADIVAALAQAEARCQLLLKQQ